MAYASSRSTDTKNAEQRSTMNETSARRRFLRVMNPKHTHSGHKAPEGMGPVIVTVFVWLVICVFFSTQAVKYNYEVNSLTKDRDELKTKNKMLEYKLQAMMSGEQIELVAKTRYGFKVPDRKNVFVVKKERSIGDRIENAFKGLFSHEKEI
jgi:cell division protein FtsL